MAGRRTLYLLRHAKSSWDSPGLKDFDRPLNKRGETAAPLMGRLMKERSIDPDLILCSPAARTRQTLKLISSQADFSSKVELESRIYAASLQDLYKVLKGITDAVSEALLIGHNPGIEELQESLCGEYEHFPTCALARLELSVESWSNSTVRCGSLKWLLRPKELSSDL